MRIVKIAAAALAAVVALLAVAVAIFLWSFDPNDYKGVITAYVEDRTGRTLAIEDDLELSLFPWLAVETGGITIGNAPGFPEPDFASIESASASIRVWPLLSRRIEIGSVALEGFNLNVGRDAEGRGNWEDLLDLQDAGAAGEAGPTEPASAASIAGLRVAGVAIRNGRIVWRENGEVRYIVDGLRLGTGAIREAGPVDVSFGLGVLDVTSQLRFELSAEATLELDGASVAARDIATDFRLLDSESADRVSGELEVTGVEIRDGGVEVGAMTLTSRLSRPPVGPDELDVTAAWTGAAFDAEARTLSVAGLVTRADRIEARWDLTGVALSGAPELAGTVALTAGSAASLLELLGVALPGDLDVDSIGPVDAAAHFAVDLGTRHATLSDVTARLLGIQIAGGASLAGERIDATIDIPRFTPGAALLDLVEAYVPATVDVGAIDSLALGGGLEADLGTGRAALTNFRAELLGGNIVGSLSMEPTGGGRRLRGSVATGRLDGAAVASVFGELLGDTIDARELGTLTVNTSLDVDTAADRAVLTDLRVDAFGLSALGNVDIENMSEAPSVSGRASLPGFDPRDLLRRFGQPAPQTSDDTVFRRASIEARFAIDADAGRFDDIVVDLDDSHVTGSFTVSNFERPSYRFALAADVLDVDRYLPPPAEEAAEGERKAGDIALAPEPLNNLRIDGEAQVANLKLANLRFQNVSTRLEVGDGEARIESARANLYGGEFDGAFFVDTNGAAPSMTLNGRATGLDLEPLIIALTGDANVSGTGSFDIDLTGRGATVTDNLTSAAGNVSFALSDGAIDGFNLGRTLCAAYNLSQQLPAPPEAPAVTAFQVIQAAATVRDGVASSPELLARASFMDVTGSGQLGLADQRLDYDMTATLTAPIGLARCESMDGLIGGSIPFTIRGTVTQAEIRPDFGKILEDRIRDELQDRARERIEDRLRDRLRDLL